MDRVLITGVPGAGKSTVLTLIAYKWANDLIFPNQFEFLIKVKLSSILNMKLTRTDEMNKSALLRLI